MNAVTHTARSRSERLSVAVIVCVFSEQRWSEMFAAIASVHAQTRRPDEVVVVVDHNDALLDRLSAHLTGVTLVPSAGPRGLATARNTGVALTTSDVVAFLDDDAVAAPTWLARLLEPYDEPHVLGVGGRVLPEWVAGRPDWMPWEFDWVVGCSYLGLPLMTAEVRNFIGANMSFRRGAVIEVGGFVADLGRIGTLPLGCEETELCIRVRERFPGAGLRYEPAALVRHRVPAARGTWSYFVRRCRAEGLSKAAVARRVGVDRALESERTYVRHTLMDGVRTGLRDAVVGRRPASAARTAAIALGLTVTGIGYVHGALRSSWLDRRVAAGGMP
jgi:GT2 family glycosyltransferase